MNDKDTWLHLPRHDINWSLVACTCFRPTVPLPWRTWPGKFRPPLGRPYDGTCHADSGRPHVPDRDVLLAGCNIGYARGICARVPDDSPDAVRFSLREPGTIRWVVEREHRPVAHGIVQPGTSTGLGPLLDWQVAAFAEQSCQSPQAGTATLAPSGETAGSEGIS